jgi:hypothetical protein
MERPMVGRILSRDGARGVVAMGEDLLEVTFTTLRHARAGQLVVVRDGRAVALWQSAESAGATGVSGSPSAVGVGAKQASHSLAAPGDEADAEHRVCCEEWLG